MVRGLPLSDDLRGVILYMVNIFDVETIVKYTGCKKRTVERVLADYRNNGTILRHHLQVAQELRGTKRSLTTTDVRVRPPLAHCRHLLII